MPTPLPSSDARSLQTRRSDPVRRDERAGVHRRDQPSPLEQLTPSLIVRGPEFDLHRRDEPSNDRQWANDPLCREGLNTRGLTCGPSESLCPSAIPAPRMEHLWSPAGATGGNRWQMGDPRKPLKQADPQMVRRGSTVRVRQRASVFLLLGASSVG
jgi:hypothetical protein